MKEDINDNIFINRDLILDNMVDGLFAVDKNCVITFWNKAAEQILGYKKKEIIGKTCDFLKSPTCMIGNVGKMNGRCCPLFSEGHIVRKRCIVPTKNGVKKYLLKNAQVLKDKHGNIIGGIENIVDITDQVGQEEELNILKKELKKRKAFFKIIGTHYTMQNIYDLLDLAKDSNATVLIYGESGTGKELVAHAIHYSSKRRNGPLVKVNCAALAESLLESELFGHIRGAFTDAVRNRKGRFEEAQSGTIFLDEIGDLPLSVQIKLLRVLQEKVIERVGDNKPVKIDVRVISATNKDLKRLIQQGRFREDLYYRLNVIPINIPPLRERKTDIPLLIEYFLDKFCKETGKCIVGCSQKTLELLMRYAWPGNVRELENVIEYAFVTCRTDKIQPGNLPEHIIKGQMLGVGVAPLTMSKDEEKTRIMSALDMAGGNRIRASKILGYSRVTLWKKMKKFDIRNKKN